MLDMANWWTKLSILRRVGLISWSMILVGGIFLVIVGDPLGWVFVGLGGIGTAVWIYILGAASRSPETKS